MLTHHLPADLPSAVFRPAEIGPAEIRPALHAPALQEVTTTPSRRSQPAAWLRGVEFLVAAGLHPRATGTTLTVAHDLAARMDYIEGTVLYRIEEMAERLGIGVATLKRHIKYLRELGTLAWVRHGSLANLQLPGRAYTATATIYAATLPPAYDEAMGHRVDGEGYGARVVGVTEFGREHAVNAVLTSGSREPQSLTTTPYRGKVKVEERLKDIAQRAMRKIQNAKKQVSDELPTKRRRRSTQKTGRKSERPRSLRSPLQVAKDILIAQQVRPLVGWTQGEGLRRLAYALRLLIDKGLDARRIAAELTGMTIGLRWRPARPAAFITARLGEQERFEAELREHERELARAALPQDNAEWCRAVRELEARCDPPPRTDEDRRRARAHAVHDPARVIAHLEEHGFDDTVDLYGAGHTAQAERWAASPYIRLG